MYNLTQKEYKFFFHYLTTAYRIDVDVAADAIASATINWDKKKAKTKFVTYLLNIAQRMQITEWRRKKRNNEEPILTDYIQQEEDNTINEIAHDIYVVCKMLQKKAYNKKKYDWFIYYYQNLSTFPECAKIFSVNENTYKIGVQRVREEVKKYFKNNLKKS